MAQLQEIKAGDQVEILSRWNDSRLVVSVVRTSDRYIHTANQVWVRASGNARGAGRIPSRYIVPYQAV